VRRKAGQCLWSNGRQLMVMPIEECVPANDDHRGENIMRSWRNE
jgi:hypothetical protein